MNKSKVKRKAGNKIDYISAFTKKLDLTEIITALQDLNSTLRSSNLARADYYGRRGDLGKIRTEVEPLAAYVREVYSGKEIVTLWDEGDEIFDARLYKNKEDSKPVEYVQLTLTQRVASQAQQDRLLSKSVGADSNSLEKQKYFELNIQEQLKQPDFILDAQTGLYQYLIDIAIALVKKTHADYSEEARSTIIIGIDLPPQFHELLTSQAELLRHIAWSLSHVESGVTDVYLVTWPERFAISVNECKKNYEIDFRFTQENYPNTLSTSIARQNESGYVSKAATSLIIILSDITKQFFPPENKSNPQTSADEMRHIGIEWAIPLLDGQNRITKNFVPAFRVTFSRDFCEVFAARGFRESDLNTISAHIQHFILRYMTEQIQSRAINLKTLIFGSSYFE